MSIPTPGLTEALKLFVSSIDRKCDDVSMYFNRYSGHSYEEYIAEIKKTQLLKGVQVDINEIKDIITFTTSNVLVKKTNKIGIIGKSINNPQFAKYYEKTSSWNAVQVNSDHAVMNFPNFIIFMTAVHALSVEQEDPQHKLIGHIVKTNLENVLENRIMAIEKTQQEIESNLRTITKILIELDTKISNQHHIHTPSFQTHLVTEFEMLLKKYATSY